MDIIHLLPDSVANQIAAGEVIQRPASCLKELVENSLDAGATHIQVLVRDAGRTLLQVTDDGKGMSETDARMAFERHATSKITEAADLFALTTMGFRGEALASICAVAQVSLTTKREEDELGTLLEIDGSTVVRQEPIQCAKGTNIKVKNLFYNVPARRRFLKTDATELRNLLQDFYRIVLVYPNVAFTFVSDDEILLDLPQATYKRRIENVFQKSIRKSFAEHLVDVNANTEIVNIHGFVGKPEAAQKGQPEYFFVNGRYMRHPYFHKAVMSAYSGMLQAEQTPAYFIYFDIAPSAIDVNIHPTKTEIKFIDEQSIFQILLATVREALGKFNLIPSLDFNRAGEIDMPSSRDLQPSSTPTVHVDNTYNPFKTRERTYQPSVAGWQHLYENASPITKETNQLLVDIVAEPVQESLLARADAEQSWQFAGKYIFVSVANNLLVIDQHRAHTAILYHRFMEQIKVAKPCSQQLLFPDTIDLQQDDALLLSEMRDDLASLGFDIEAIGPSSFILNGVPPQLGEQNGVRSLLGLLAAVKQTGEKAKQRWQQTMASALAKSIALPYDKLLTHDEVVDLVNQLKNLNTNLTPEGKKVSVQLNLSEIDKYF